MDFVCCLRYRHHTYFEYVYIEESSMTNIYYVGELVVYTTSKVADSTVIEANVLDDKETEQLWRVYAKRV